MDKERIYLRDYFHQEYYQTQAKILKSRPLAKQVIQKLHLAEQFVQKPHTSISVVLSQIAQGVLNNVNLQKDGYYYYAYRDTN